MNDISWVELAVFMFFFLLVTVMGFMASRWRRASALDNLDEWGLGGRGFGTFVTWFLIGGDIRHSEVPISATVGYSFNRLEPISPFVRAGLVHHFVDGDQYKSSSPGPLVAVGIDFTHIIVEASWDDSEVTFDKLNCDASGAQCSLGEATLSTYEYLLAVYWRFR